MLPHAQLASLLERAEGELAAFLAAVQAAWARRDLAETHREAHKIAGLAGNVGCNALMTAARAVESDARAGAPAEQITARLAALAAIQPPTLAALREWRAGLAAPPA